MLQRTAFDEHDIAGLDGNVGSGAHGDTEIGLGQRRRIVDAVADERDALFSPPRFSATIGLRNSRKPYRLDASGRAYR